MNPRNVVELHRADCLLIQIYPLFNFQSQLLLPSTGTNDRGNGNRPVNAHIGCVWLRNFYLQILMH